MEGDCSGSIVSVVQCSPEEDANEDGALCANQEQEPGELVAAVGVVGTPPAAAARRVSLALLQNHRVASPREVHDVTTCPRSDEVQGDRDGRGQEIGHPEQVSPVGEVDQKLSTHCILPTDYSIEEQPAGKVGGQ